MSIYKYLGRTYSIILTYLLCWAGWQPTHHQICHPRHVPHHQIRHPRHVPPKQSHRSHAIVPNIMVHNYPVGHHSVGHSGATISAPEVFEIKTYPGCKMRYAHANTMSTADRRAKKIRNKYIRKFMNLNKMTTADIVGHRSGTGEE